MGKITLFTKKDKFIEIPGVNNEQINYYSCLIRLFTMFQLGNCTFWSANENEFNEFTTKCFCSAPFTIQRLCELLTEPNKHYQRIDKFLRGIEKV